jgi:hypothetical protein
MHIRYTKLTGDGLLNAAAILLGAGLGFCAVVKQMRQSARQFRDQLAAQEETRRAEAARRKKSLATALLFEIWDFYCNHVKPVPAMEEGSSAQHIKFFYRSFDVWKSNAGQIGELDGDLVKELVHFYDVASEYLGIYDRYLSLENSPDEQRTFFKEQLAPKLRGLEGPAEKAWLRLCPAAGMEPQSLRCDASESGEAGVGERQRSRDTT